MERPVVAASVTGPEELILQDVTGCLVKSEAPQDFAGPISTLLHSPELRGAFGVEGKRRVIKNFSIDTYVQGVEKIFEEVFKG